MQRASLFTRDDTFFGVCEGLGSDFGIHPNFLRVAFAGFLFWNPYAALATYAGAGLVVFVSRWFVPEPAASKAAPVLEQPVAVEAEERLPLAA